jgi:regulator of RNase E activity RraA
LASADFGECVVGPDDVVFADADGVLFAPSDRLEAIVATAMDIRDTERRQAGAMAAGTSLRRQLDFDAYLAARNEDPRLTFRQHLRSVGGEIEE